MQLINHAGVIQPLDGNQLVERDHSSGMNWTMYQPPQWQWWNECSFGVNSVMKIFAIIDLMSNKINLTEFFWNFWIVIIKKVKIIFRICMMLMVH